MHSVSRRTSFRILHGIPLIFMTCLGADSAFSQTGKPDNPSARNAPPSGDILQASGEIPLAEVKGPVGKMTVDLVRNRLFVVAPDDDAVLVVDMGDKKVVQKISIAKPRGVVHMPGIDLVGVSSADDGKVHILNGSKLDEVRAIAVGKEPADMLFDAAAQLIYVAYGRPGIAPIDPITGKREHDIDVVAVPSVMRMDQAGEKIYAAIPRGNVVAVIDREKRMGKTSWFIREARDVVSLALDDADNAAFVGCRTPPTLFSLDFERGVTTSSIALGKGCEDMYFDAVAKRIYVTEGEGIVGAIQFEPPNGLKQLVEVPTAPNAKTSFWVKETRTLYVGVPAHDSKPAEILILKAGM